MSIEVEFDFQKRLTFSSHLNASIGSHIQEFKRTASQDLPEF